MGDSWHGALAEVAAAHDLDRQLVGNDDAFAAAHFAPWPHERSPAQAVGGLLLGQKHFDSSAVSLAMAVEPGGEHARVVQHQAIAGMEERRELAESSILPGSRFAIHHQHARRGAIRERLLRDQLFGKVVVEIGKQHRWSHRFVG